MSDTPTLGLIRLTETSEEFANGYQVGLLRYRLEHANRPLTDCDVYEVLASILYDTRHTDRYRAGVIAGWFAGLYAHSVQLGYTLPTLVMTPVASDTAMSSGMHEQQLPAHHDTIASSPLSRPGQAHHMAPLIEEWRLKEWR
jgi:hypothetical protein